MLSDRYISDLEMTQVTAQEIGTLYKRSRGIPQITSSRFHHVKVIHQSKCWPALRWI